MADYYSLLARAVAAMPHSTAEQRRAVYERARTALLTQLRAIDPPVSEVDVARESSSLDGAVAQIELEIAAKAAENDRPSSKESITKEPVNREPVNREPVNKEPIKDTALRGPIKEPLFKGSASVNSSSSHLPKLRPTSPFSDAAQNDEGESPEDFESVLIATGAKDDRGSDEAIAPEPRVQRPEAPLRSRIPVEQRRRLILGATAACVVLGIAFTAFALRGRPVETAPTKSDTSTSEEQPAPGKISGRATGSDDKRSNAQPTNPAPAQPRGANESIPLAHKANLFVAAPNAPEQVKIYTGSVIWRFENVPTGPGQPLGAQIHADVDIPDAGLHLVLDIKKVAEATLAFSHTIELSFTTLQGAELPGVKDIGVVQMRREEARRGDSLAGMVAQIIANSRYLVVLQRGDQEKRNLELIRDRSWLDIPILMTDGRAAKLSLEKGLTGERVFNDAFTAWAAER